MKTAAAINQTHVRDADVPVQTEARHGVALLEQRNDGVVRHGAVPDAQAVDLAALGHDDLERTAFRPHTYTRANVSESIGTGVRCKRTAADASYLSVTGCPEMCTRVNLAWFGCFSMNLVMPWIVMLKFPPTSML